MRGGKTTGGSDGGAAAVSAFESETENPLAATFEEEPSGAAADDAAADRPEMERQRFNRGFNESEVELAAQALELGITQYQVDEAMDSDSQDRRRELLIDLIQADASSKEQAEVSHRHYFEWALVCSNMPAGGADHATVRHQTQTPFARDPSPWGLIAVSCTAQTFGHMMSRRGSLRRWWKS